MAYKASTNDDQFLRRFFDTLYEITPENVRRVLTSIPMKVRWMMVSTAAAAVLVYVVLQLTIAGVEAIEWANRKPLLDYMTAPYDLELRPLPMAMYTNIDQPFPKVDGAAVQESLAPLLEQANLEAQATAEAAYNTAMESYVATEGSVAPVLEDFLPQVDEFGLLLGVLPSMEPAYFAMSPVVEGYERTYIFDNRMTHPLFSCVVDAESACFASMSSVAPYVEAADYINADNDMMRFAAIRYETPTEAYEASIELMRYSRTLGTMGDFSVMAERPVTYFYSNAQGWRLFSWSNGSWVYMIAGKDTQQLEQVITQYPY